MNIRRLDHVSMAVREVEDYLPLLTKLFGMKLARRFDHPDEGYRGVVLDIPGGNVQLEVIEPVGEGGFLTRFLEERGPGLHHVAFEVEDVVEAVEAIRQWGLEALGGVRSMRSWRETFLHPRDMGGVLVQLYEGSWI